jgi:hypothetical protein
LGQHVSSLNDMTGNLTAADVFGSVPTGTNARMGRTTLVAGTATVANTSVTADSIILVTTQTLGAGTEGFVVVSARTPGTSFTLLSSQATDVAEVGWLILEPA